MSNVFKAIDKAPFAGKFAVRDRVVEYQQAGPSQEKPCYDKTMRFLGFMVGAHALQAKMGLDAAQTHMGQFMHNGHMIDALAGGGDLSYAAVNTLVSLRQASLGQRTYQAHKRRKRRYSEMNEEQKAALDERSKARETTSGKTSSKAVMGAVAFTLSMQALFGVSYYDAKDTEAQAACTASASAHYDDYAATHQEDNLEPKAGYIQRECSTD